MSALTEFFKLIKPSKGDRYKVQDFDDNFDKIDVEMHKPPLSVNGVFPNPTTRDLPLNVVPLAQNLATDIAQVVTGSFIQRTTGGGASVESGKAYASIIGGEMTHTGVVAESLEMTVSGDAITAEIDRETFVAYVDESGTYTLTYTTAWSADPALYGVTVTGTPENGDSIVIVYVKGSRGTITPATPSSFNSTGWNLFNNVTGIARVCKYSDTLGFRVGGNYTGLSFATSASATSEERTEITVDNGLFNVPSDGFVFVTGGDSTTYIYATWTDWVDGYVGNFQGYMESTIDITEIMVLFEDYGLCAIGVVRDEINFNTHTATRKIGRLAYSAENLATVIASGQAYEADDNFIYYVLADPMELGEFSLSNEYTVNDHGIEFFTDTDAPAYAEILYGDDLKDKLRTDVVTISPQTLTTAQKTQVRNNIGAAAASELSTLFLYKEYQKSYTNLAAGASKTFTVSDFGIVAPTGYRPIAIKRFSSGSSLVSVAWINTFYGSGDVMAIVNNSGSAKSGTATVGYVWVKSAFVTEIS